MNQPYETGIPLVTDSAVVTPGFHSIINLILPTQHYHNNWWVFSNFSTSFSESWAKIRYFKKNCPFWPWFGRFWKIHQLGPLIFCRVLEVNCQKYLAFWFSKFADMISYEIWHFEEKIRMIVQPWCSVLNVNLYRDNPFSSSTEAWTYTRN